MNYKIVLVYIFMCFISFNSFAGTQISGTRVIFDGKSKEASISIKNPDLSPYLIQSWIEDINNNVQDDMPLIVAPPLFKLNGGDSNSLRIMKTGDLRQDQESAFWLNIKAIPASSPDAKNELQISVNTRIKIFYRPNILSSQQAAQAYEKLIFLLKNNELIVENPTPYYVSFGKINLNGINIIKPGMVSPNNKLILDTKQIKKLNKNEVSWSAINDFGSETVIKKIQF